MSTNTWTEEQLNIWCNFWLSLLVEDISVKESSIFFYLTATESLDAGCSYKGDHWTFWCRWCTSAYTLSESWQTVWRPLNIAASIESGSLCVNVSIVVQNFLPPRKKKKEPLCQGMPPVTLIWCNRTQKPYPHGKFNHNIPNSCPKVHMNSVWPAISYFTDKSCC